MTFGSKACTQMLAAAVAAGLCGALLVPTQASAASQPIDPIAAVSAAERSLGLEDDLIGDTPRIMDIGEPTPVLAAATDAEVTPGATGNDSNDLVDYTADQLSPDTVRFAAVIHGPDADAPSWDFGDGAELIPLGDGRVSITDRDGELMAGVETPWAVDAAGAPIPTSYRVEGTTLHQDVAVTDDTQYPVVVDPRYTAFPGYWTVTFNRAESATVVGTVASCAALFSKSPVPVLRALTVTCGVLAAFSTAQLAGGKCVKLHLAGLPGVIAQWWPLFPKC